MMSDTTSSDVYVHDLVQHHDRPADIVVQRANLDLGSQLELQRWNESFGQIEFWRQLFPRLFQKVVVAGQNRDLLGRLGSHQNPTDSGEVNRKLE